MTASERRKRNAQRQAGVRRARAAAGTCLTCGNREPDDGKNNCGRCIEQGTIRRRNNRERDEQPNAAITNVVRKVQKQRDRFDSDEEYDAHVAGLSRRRTYSKPSKKGKGKLKRSPHVKMNALHRSMRATGVMRCEITGREFKYGLHVHHVRTEPECDALGILWDSPQNVLAIEPNEHARLHYSRAELETAYAIIDAMYPRPAAG